MSQGTTLKAIGAAGLAALAAWGLAAALLLQGGNPDAGAAQGSAPGVVERIYISMEAGSDPVSPPGAVTPFADRTVCASIPVGGSIEVDVIVDRIDAATPLGAFEYRLNFDEGIVDAALNNEVMLAGNPGASVIDVTQLSEPGMYLVAVADFRQDDNYVHGAGVLSRIELTGLAEGVSDLFFGRDTDPPGMVFVDGLTGEGYGPANTIGDARIAVGTPCPGPDAPTPGPGPGATPGPGSDPTPGPGEPPGPAAPPAPTLPPVDGADPRK